MVAGRYFGFGVGRRAALAALALGVGVAMAVGAPTAGPATAAPTGRVDPGVPFSSVVYGTGCTYWLTQLVNSRGTVTFWETRQGYAPHLIARTQPQWGQATVRWIPQRQGNRLLYTEQNGVRSAVIVARVHQGYGSGGTCFAL